MPASSERKRVVAPSAKGNEDRIADLEDQVEQDRNKVLDHDVQVRALTNGAVTKAFTIFFAYIIQDFFFIVARDNLYDAPYSDFEVFWIRLAWFLIVVALCPIAVRSARGIASAGARPVPYLKNQKALWGASIMMIVGWGFKDVCVSLIKLHQQPKNCYPKIDSSCDDKTQEYRAGYCFYLVGIAFLSVFFNHFFTEAWKAIERCSLNKEGSCAQMMAECGAKFKTARPLSLGVGLLCNAAMEGPWNMFLWYLIRYGNDGPEPVDSGDYNFRWTVMIWTRCIVHTSLIVMLHIWFNKRDSTNKCGTMAHGLLETFVHSTSFNLAWSWSDVTTFTWYTLFYNCEAPFSRASCGSGIIWLRFFYAFLLTVLMIIVVPALKAKERLVLSLGGNYASQMLKQDALAIQSEKIYNNLYTAMFGVIVGWGWTGLLFVECEGDYTFTCPGRYTVFHFAMFAANSTLYVILAGVAFHIFMEKVRLEQRALKAQQIEHKEAERFFKEIDKDKNGMIDRKELETFVSNYGFNSDCFDEAYNRVVKVNGKNGEELPEADMYQLIAHFGDVVDEYTARDEALLGAASTDEVIQDKSSGVATRMKPIKEANPLSKIDDEDEPDPKHIVV